MVLALCWDGDKVVLGDVSTVVWMDPNVEHPGQESASSFICFSEKSEGDGFLFLPYTHKPHRMGEGRIPASAPRFERGPQMLPLRAPGPLWGVCALGPSRSCVVNGAGEGNNVQGGGDAGRRCITESALGGERLMTMSAFITDFTFRMSC